MKKNQPNGAVAMSPKPIAANVAAAINAFNGPKYLIILPANERLITPITPLDMPARVVTVDVHSNCVVMNTCVIAMQDTPVIKRNIKSAIVLIVPFPHIKGHAAHALPSLPVQRLCKEVRLSLLLIFL